jgi:cation diffusion facilitator CzcD-associated flavoprotein CzcO
VVTDTIGALRPGRRRAQLGPERLDADIVATATGLELQFASDLEVIVDGGRVEITAKTVGYKGMMFSGVPDFTVTSGYTNASWTLKAGPSWARAGCCRLLAHMDRRGMRRCVPVLEEAGIDRIDWVGFSSGYIQRARERFPSQGAEAALAGLCQKPSCWTC